jgi:mevalonate kinase
MILKISAPGKVILSGEHAVVYGYPALVAAVDRYLKIEVKRNKNGLSVEPFWTKGAVQSAIQKVSLFLRIKPSYNYSIKIYSSIPISCGMGSSAAFAVAISASILKGSKKSWSKRLINDLAFEIEKGYHGQSSGVDNTVSVRGGYLWYRKESEKVKLFYKIKVNKRPQNLYIVNSGKPKESTRQMITLVRNLYESKRTYTINIFSGIERVSRGFLRYLLGEEASEIADLIKENQKLLEKLGVVSSSTKKLVKKIERCGGAAKVSGAGGFKENSGMLLIHHRDKDKLQSVLEKEGLIIENIKLGVRGVYVK